MTLLLLDRNCCLLFTYKLFSFALFKYYLIIIDHNLDLFLYVQVRFSFARNFIKFVWKVNSFCICSISIHFVMKSNCLHFLNLFNKRTYPSPLSVLWNVFILYSDSHHQYLKPVLLNRRPAITCVLYHLLYSHLWLFRGYTFHF